MTIGILRFYTNTQSRLASAGTTENASKDAMANRLCTRSKEIGSCTCRRWWRRGFANWAFGHAGPSRSAKPNCTKKTGRWIEWRLRKIEEPRQPASSANAPEAAEAVPGSLQNHRNGNTHQAARPLDLQTAPDGTLLPVAVTGAGHERGGGNRATRRYPRPDASYSLQFTSEDIRAIGLTMFIQAMWERGVTWDQR